MNVQPEIVSVSSEKTLIRAAKVGVTVRLESR